MINVPVLLVKLLKLMKHSQSFTRALRTGDLRSRHVVQKTQYNCICPLSVDDIFPHRESLPCLHVYSFSLCRHTFFSHSQTEKRRSRHLTEVPTAHSVFSVYCLNVLRVRYNSSSIHRSLLHETLTSGRCLAV